MSEAYAGQARIVRATPKQPLTPENGRLNWSECKRYRHPLAATTGHRHENSDRLAITSGRNKTGLLGRTVTPARRESVVLHRQRKTLWPRALAVPFKYDLHVRDGSEAQRGRGWSQTTVKSSDTHPDRPASASGQLEPAPNGWSRPGSDRNGSDPALPPAGGSPSAAASP